MTTKVEPTVEKWLKCPICGENWHSLEHKLMDIGSEVEATCISEEEGLKRIKALLSHSVQEAKAEERDRVLDIVYKAFDETVIENESYDYGFPRKLKELLASLKQEEEKI